MFILQTFFHQNLTLFGAFSHLRSVFIRENVVTQNFTRYQ